MNRPAIEFAIERLKELQGMEDIQYLFGMGNWGNSASSHPADEPEPDCGFAGCFIGWAAHQQWFDRFGLHLRLVKEERFNNFYPRVDGVEGIPATHLDAVADFLGIGRRALDCVIMPDFYPGEEASPQDVADRLTDLLAMGEAEFVDIYPENPDDEDVDD